MDRQQDTVRVVQNFVIPLGLLFRLKAQAGAEGRSRSRVVCEALERYLKEPNQEASERAAESEEAGR